MSIADDGSRKPELIEDITAPKGKGFDVRQPGVRRQAIGRLNQRYLLSRASYTGLGDVSEHILGSRPTEPILKYRRVPPLRTLGFGPHQEVIPVAIKKYSLIAIGSAKLFLLGLSNRLSSALQKASIWRRRAALLLLAPIVWLKEATWLPKTYTLKRGLTNDWRGETSRLLKTVTPLLIILFALAWYIASLFDLTPGQAQIRHGAGVARNSAQAAPASSVNPAGTSPNRPSTNSSYQGANSQSGSLSPTLPIVNLVDGQPSGSRVASPTPTPQTNLPLPYTVSVPPVDVQAGGKRIISTTGSTITLN